MDIQFITNARSDNGHLHKTRHHSRNAAATISRRIVVFTAGVSLTKQTRLRLYAGEDADIVRGHVAVSSAEMDMRAANYFSASSVNIVPQSEQQDLLGVPGDAPSITGQICDGARPWRNRLVGAEWGELCKNQV